MTILSQGQIIWDKYKVDQRVGQGGAAIVYKVHQIDEPQSPLAAKIVREDQLRRYPHLEQQFRFESRLHPTLRHTHIPDCQAVFDDPKSPPMGIVMEFINGISLRERLSNHRSQKGMSSNEIMSMIKHISEALTYLHLMGWVHCDVKPENVMQSEKGWYLTDVGIATRIGERTDTKRGTHKYMAPEQFLMETLHPATDVYGFGILLYEILTNGNVPFNQNMSGQATDMENQHIYQQAPPPSQFNPNIRDSIEAVVMQALNKDPRQRYGSVKEFVRHLEDAFYSTDHSRQYSVSPPPILSTTQTPNGQLVNTRYNSHKMPDKQLSQQVTIGRSRECDLVIPGAMVSRRHAMIQWDQERGYVLSDMDSKIGTHLNGHRLSAYRPCQITVGDVITIDEFNFVFTTGEKHA